MKTTLRVCKTGEVQYKTACGVFEPLKKASIVLKVLGMPHALGFMYENDSDMYDYTAHITCGNYNTGKWVDFDFSDITKFDNKLEDVVSKLKELKSEILEWYETLPCQEIEVEF